MILYGPFQTNLSARIDGCAFVVFWLASCVYTYESTSTCMDGCLVGWMVGWGWLAGTLVRRLAGLLAGWLTVLYARMHVHMYA